MKFDEDWPDWSLQLGWGEGGWKRVGMLVCWVVADWEPPGARVDREGAPGALVAKKEPQVPVVAQREPQVLVVGEREPQVVVVVV